MAAGLLEGKVAVISGIGPGMGRDIALLFAEHGADVVLGARTLERCEAVAEEVRAFGGRAEPVRLDVTDESSCAAAVGAAVSAFGGVDVLVNNAFADGNHRSFAESLLEEWRATTEVHLRGPSQIPNTTVAGLLTRGGGPAVVVTLVSRHRARP